MLNVLMFAIDENVYFSYQPYPHFTMRKHSILEYPTFAPSFPNMHGQPLIVMPDQSHPRTIVYRNNRTGALVLTGSVGRFVRTLAWKLNATLQYPVPIVPGRVLHSVELQAIADDMAIDVPAGMVELTDSEQLSRAPYPFELTHICLMIPLANDIPLKDIYLYLNSASNILIALSIIYSYGLVLALHKCHVEQKDARLVDFLLNDAALRGLFGLPFRLANNASACCRLIYVILGVMGLNLNCIYNAHLGTMLTHPPQQPQPRTYTDVRQAGLPLAIHEHDLDIAKDMHLRLLPLNSSELNRLRDNMNTSNVYLCTRIHWSLYSAQQQYFARELFIFSPDACYSQLSLLSFQMPNNSWLVEPMNELIMDVRANGIFQYWLERHFFDMAAAGLVSFKDLSPARNYGGALQLAHLQWIWYAYIILLSIAFCIFVMEIAFNHIRLHRN
ncbi:uncharacterized protein LOC115629765 [Scaptodrosophila lebanonensis]|uniref:Uncharacterized protein LOC115629765 n=1 Tax=Drosophila lebanonensis TaxID=7225 RepID=A0A6J2U0I3_DROLE|nr:uncharacterized protein LOC115629765 [Scaptodrosophila lebanonensis]